MSSSSAGRGRGSGGPGITTTAAAAATTAASSRTRRFPGAMRPCPVRVVGVSGWSWLVLGAACLSHASTGGLYLSTGVLYSHVMATFNSTSQIQAAWTVSLSWSFGPMLAPIFTAMCIKYGVRAVCILGGFVAALGMLFNSFSEELAHVYVSYSLIASAGLSMCQAASAMAVVAHFQRAYRRAMRAYSCAQWVGAVVFSLLVDHCVESLGWLRGLQVSTVLVAINFLLGCLLTTPDSYQKLVRLGRPRDLPIALRDCFDLEALRDGTLIGWLVLEMLVFLGITPPLVLMVMFPGGSLWRRPLALVALGGAAAAGCVCWQLLRRCIHVSPLFFLQQQLLLAALIEGAMCMATQPEDIIVSATLLGLVLGGLLANCTLEVASLVEVEREVRMRGLVFAARGVGALIGCPLAVWLSTLRAPALDLRVGFLLCACALCLAFLLLLAMMRRLRRREVDIWQERMSALCWRHVVVQQQGSGQSRCGSVAVQTGAEDEEVTRSEDQPVPPQNTFYCVDGNLVELIESLEMGLLDGDGYGRAQGLDGLRADGGAELEDDDCQLYGRRRTLAEPSLPVLFEVPSQETSSVSRVDNSCQSTRENDSSGDKTAQEWREVLESVSRSISQSSDPSCGDRESVFLQLPRSRPGSCKSQKSDSGAAKPLTPNDTEAAKIGAASGSSEDAEDRFLLTSLDSRLHYPFRAVCNIQCPQQVASFETTV